jgi:xylulose-5-phosphate/fructose-6-phosphate phosphoketolase
VVRRQSFERHDLPRANFATRAAYAKQAIRDKLIHHKEYIARYGDDMPEITGWMWGQKAASAGVRPTEADNI